MLKSMTGFGTHKIRNEEFEIKVDIKSVNNRYLDIQIKGPKSLIFLEEKLKKVISQRVTRGKVDVFIDIKFLEIKDTNFDINISLLNNYIDNINKISKIMNCKNDMSPMNLLRYDNDLLTIEKTELSENSYFINSCEECIEVACINFLEMKKEEGYNIQNDLIFKLKELRDTLTSIKLHSKDLVNIQIKLLKDRISEILGNEDVPIDEDRLVNEIVFYSDKLSIDEEIVRLESHFSLFENILKDENSNGKKMDFIIQEMNRETNTIGSKSSNIDVTNEVINMKSIIEKMREQVQNIE